MWCIHGIFTAVATALVSLVLSSPPNAAERPPVLVREEFMIDAADPGIKLYVVNKHLTNLRELSSEKILLFVHGATQPAEATFDLSLDGMHGWITSPGMTGTSIWSMCGAMVARRVRLRWTSLPRAILPSSEPMSRSATSHLPSTSSSSDEEARRSISSSGRGAR